LACHENDQIQIEHMQCSHGTRYNESPFYLIQLMRSWHTLVHIYIHTYIPTYIRIVVRKAMKCALIDIAVKKSIDKKKFNWHSISLKMPLMLISKVAAVSVLPFHFIA